MNDCQSEVLAIFRKTGALLDGHFVLRSGLHSSAYFQCAMVCQYMEHVERLAELLLSKVGEKFDTVLSPAMGGLVIGQEVARQARARFIFCEKENGALVLRRGFKLSHGEKVLVVEDVVTRGGRAQETIDIARHTGATPIAIAVLVDRSDGKAQFDIPLYSLAQLSFPTYPADQLPPELAARPIEKPGS